MLHVKGWGWLEGDTKWTPESPAKSVLVEGPFTLLVYTKTSVSGILWYKRYEAQYKARHTFSSSSV